MSCLDYSGVPSVDKIDGQFATAHGLPVTIVIETDKQGNKVLVNSAQVHTHTYTHIHIHTHTYTHTYIHTHTHTYTHPHTHTHTYTHTLTHTHTLNLETLKRPQYKVP